MPMPKRDGVMSYDRMRQLLSKMAQALSEAELEELVVHMHRTYDLSDEDGLSLDSNLCNCLASLLVPRIRWKEEVVKKSMDRAWAWLPWRRGSRRR